MIDPITAMAAVSAAVNMIKKAAATVDDVRSLGPLIGKYFDAKHECTQAVKQAKKSGGSNLGKAIEIELQLKSQRDFEEQIKGLFFPNNMDVWAAIEERVAEMNKADAAEERLAKAKAARAKQEMQEAIDVAIALVMAFVVLAILGFFIYQAVTQ